MWPPNTHDRVYEYTGEAKRALAPRALLAVTDDSPEACTSHYCADDQPLRQDYLSYWTFPPHEEYAVSYIISRESFVKKERGLGPSISALEYVNNTQL